LSSGLGVACTQPVIEIRPAGIADMDALVLIGVESFTATYQASTTAADVAAHLDQYFRSGAVRRELQRPECRYLLASVDSQPAGFIKLRDDQHPESIPASAPLEIQLLYIRPAHQRLGLGGRLVAAAMQVARQQAAHGLWLSTWEEADWAIGFYRKAGFYPVGTQEFRVGDTPFTDILMWQSLD